MRGPSVLQTPHDSREQFHFRLERFVNGQFSRKADQLRALLSSRRVFQRYAASLVHDAAAFSGPERLSSDAVKIKVHHYLGENSHVSRMVEFLQRHLSSALYAAFVHGSLATEEEIAYSDFDALVVIKSDVFDNVDKLAEVGYWLNRARSIMLQFDPLQHHGWFVLPEFFLTCYPEDYFPVSLFEHAKSLFPAGRTKELTLQVESRRDRFQSRFLRLANSTLADLATNRHGKNLYSLKSTLSKFMLLPSLYVQARDGRGVFKKDSFDSARCDFDARTWRIMDEVSAIRRQWRQTYSVARRQLVSQPNVIGKLAARILAPRVTVELQRQFDDRSSRRAERLIRCMATRLGVACAEQNATGLDG